VDRELEVIRDEMEQTRANLADKLGALEEQVRETVSTASETVTSTVEGVKEVVDTVSDTVGSVTETFNISKQVEQHPMLAMGVALGAGFALSYLFSGSRQPVVVHQPPPASPPPPQPQQHAQPSQPQQHPQPTAPRQQEAESQASSLLPSLESLMPDLQSIGNTVITGLGGLAVGSVMSVVRDMVAKNLPDDWQGEITKLVDQVTRQLGGNPRPVKHEENGEDSQKQQDKQPEQKSKERPDEQERDSHRTASSERKQPAYRG
jgi:ElaB/YqjD/DUF883 family membrane-anchored ribosome-binding protein